MHDHPDAHGPDEPPKVLRDPADLQRAALRELLGLSEEAVGPVESEIEQRYRAETSAARRRFEEGGAAIEQHFRELKDSTQGTYDDQVREIQSLFESDVKALEDRAVVMRKRITAEARSSGDDLKKELGDAVWLSESVAEATIGQVSQDSKKLKKQVPTMRARLEALHEEARGLLHLYRLEVPEEPAPAVDDPRLAGDPGAVFREHYASAQRYLEELRALRTPRLYAGGLAWTFVVLMCLVSVGLAGVVSIVLASYGLLMLTVPGAILAAVAVAVGVGRSLRERAAAEARAAYGPLCQSIATARLAIDYHARRASQQLQQRGVETRKVRESEIRTALERLEPVLAEVGRRHASALERLEEACGWLRCEIEGRREAGLQQAEEQRRTRLAELEQEHEREVAALGERHHQEVDDCRQRYESTRGALRRRWDEGLACLKALLDDTAHLGQGPCGDWTDALGRQWSPPRESGAVVRFGQVRVDMKRLASGVRQHAGPMMDLSGEVSVPALLSLPNRGSLLLETDGGGREEALQALRAVMVRLLTSLAPGRVHFTILDPVGLGQNFAGFMHLADYQDALVGGRIWTDIAHIEQRLADLTDHMENVIQKYLRNEFETIDAYNVQAGELAEPYRFLVVADFPVNFTEESARRLSSVVSSGARCGVYPLIVRDTRQALPAAVAMEDVAASSIHLVRQGDRFVWQDEVFRQFPLTLDTPPAEESLTRIMHAVGRAAVDASRVEVPFAIVAPDAGNRWAAQAGDELRVPIGRTGAVRLQYLSLGRGVAQHALVAGKTGSGKSTLLHVIITNLALWYGPDEVEFYLVDFKKGVEFKAYVTHELVHARAIAIESDREFGLSVLQRVDVEMERRGELFRHYGVQDMPSYRRAAGTTLPRTLLVVDEFQVFFSEDDKLGQDAAILLDRLVRQGRAFGIHVLLGSQTLGGTSGLARSTMGQMAVRIALQCSDVDSQLILDDSNTAARLLSRPGEAIYNDVGGRVEGNSPFQTAWLPDESRDVYLEQVSALARQGSCGRDPPIVFEGNAPADIRKNRALAELLEAPEWPAPSTAPRIWLGEPVAIKAPTSVAFRRQSGAHLLIVGQRDDVATAMMSAAMVGLAAQHEPRSAQFVVLDGSAADSPLVGTLQRVASALPHSARVVEWSDVAGAIGELAAEVRRRQEGDCTGAPAVYVLVLGLQRYRMLRRQDDDFGFSRDSEEKASRPDRDFAEVLRDGPPLGVHVLVWSDTAASLERTLDRQVRSEFDHRVLFQMSAADSSNLIDSPVANRLGFHRVLFYSEEQGLLEKFRPYAVLDREWLAHVERRLKDRAIRAGTGFPSSDELRASARAARRAEP